MLDNRLHGNFVRKNVANLSRLNLKGSRISLFSKGFNFFPTSNTIDKAKLKPKLEALGRILRLKWHFRNEDNEFDLDQLSQILLSIRVIRIQPLKYIWAVWRNN